MKEVITTRVVGETQVHWQTMRRGELTSERTSLFTTSGYSGFSKPAKVIVNQPDSSGYRKPSNYATRTLNGIAVGVTMSGVRDYTQGQYRYINTLSGRAAGHVSYINKNDPNNVNELRTKILNNIKDEVFDVAMVLAEMQSTVSTLTGNLHRLGRSMAAFKKGNPHGFHYLLTGKRKDGRRPTDKFLRNTAGSYLEWKYGIMPTVLDIEGASRALDINSEGSLFSNPPLLVARAQLTQTVPLEGIVRMRLNNAAPQFDISVDRRHVLKARCDYSVSAEGVRGLSRYGIGLSTLATVAFERTPFSFVLNMAVPIADILKAWTALSGCDVKGYCETRYSQISAKSQRGPVSGIRGMASSGEGQMDAFVAPGVFTRTAYSTVPMPVPYVRNPIKAGNLATVLSLFTTLRK